MVIELLSYKGSMLNPLLKWVVLFLFLIATYYFYRCRLIYGGKLQFVATLLILGGAAAGLSSAFRIAGDLLIQWKWGESTLGLVFALITLIVAYLIRTKMKKASALFGNMGGEER